MILPILHVYLPNHSVNLLRDSGASLAGVGFKTLITHKHWLAVFFSHKPLYLKGQVIINITLVFDEILDFTDIDRCITVYFCSCAE